MQLILENLKKSFDKKEVLQDVTGTFEQGTVYALLGRNGAGKTTLFTLIAGERSKDAGSVWIEQDGHKRPLEAEDVFFMFSEPTLPNFLTGREMLAFFVEANREKIHKDVNLDQYFDQIDFAVEDRDRLLQSYSTGMKNKIQMLMFMILRPPVILMDEPLTSLDVVVQHEMKELIRSIRGEHIILFSTHILQLARDLCDSVVLLKNGKLLSVDEDLSNPDIEEQVIRLLTEEDAQ